MVMRCPKCNEIMKRTYTHHRSGDKPDVHIEVCADCNIQICWFEMKDDYIYTVDQRKEDDN